MTITEFESIMAEVARRNGDEFKTTITVDESGICVEVIETADRHRFLSGHGASTEAAIDDAIKNLPDALSYWGYN